MGFNLRVILHLAGIFIILLVLTWCILNTQYYATIMTLSLLLCVQVGLLIRFVNTTNRQLARFLLAVRHGDFSQSFGNSNIGAGFTDLSESFESVISHLRNERSDKEAQAAYLHAFVEQLPIGLLAMETDGSIALTNSALRHLIQRQELNHISQIAAFNTDLSTAITNLKPGQEESVEIDQSGNSQFLTLSGTLLRVGGIQQKLVSIQNIQSAIDAREMLAWQNLIRVMTHEIMNSITPITSLSETAQQLVNEARQAGTTEYNGNRDQFNALLEDADNAMTTIGKRSQGLMRFVESYRTLSRMPTPRVRPFLIIDLFNSVARLMDEQLTSARINLTCTCRPENLGLTADPDMLEQALINILKNSIEAMEIRSTGDIAMQAVLGENRTVTIVIKDDGPGMDQDTLDNLFIPFYTTKRQGSGIGMSVVKQIISLNGGNIRVNSQQDTGTTVNIYLKAGH